MDPGLIITLPCPCVRDSFEGLIAVTIVEDNFNLVQALGVDVGIDVDAIIDDAVNIGVDVHSL